MTAVKPPPASHRVSRLTLAVMLALVMVAEAVAPAAVQDAPGFWVPNDPYFHEQWALFNFGQSVGGGPPGTRGADISAPEAWSITRGRRDVVVAVIDTGVAYDHPDLAANIWLNEGEVGEGRENNGIDDDGNGYVDDWRGWDFADGDNDPRENRATSVLAEDVFFAHGTAVASAGFAVGDNGIGFTGIAPNVRLMVLRAWNTGIIDMNVTEAIRYAADNGADVVNLSYGSIVPGFGTTPNAELAISERASVVFVTGAGNSGNDADILKVRPCTIGAANLMCVAATDRDDMVARFGINGGSNVGPTQVHLAAPGNEILTATIASETMFVERFDDGFEEWSTEGPGAWSLEQSDTGLAIHLTVAPDETTRTEHWIRMAEPINFAGRDDCLLTFSTKTNLTYTDVVFLAASTDGENWTRLHGVDGFAETAVTDWTRRAVPLLDARGRDSVFFGFVLDRRARDLNSEVWIDDFEVTCASSDYAGVEYEYAGGTSVAAPITAGVAALILSAYPDLTPEQVKAAILSSVDQLPSLAGHVDTGGRLNAYAALLAAGEIAGGNPIASPPPTSATSALPARGALPGEAVLPPPGLPVPRSRATAEMEGGSPRCSVCDWHADPPDFSPIRPGAREPG